MVKQLIYNDNSKFIKDNKIHKINVSCDELELEFSDLTELALQLPATKRNILKITTMFYDPLGLVSPIVLQSKLIYQSLCKEKINWDTIVPESIRNVWEKFVEALRHSEKIFISRPLFNIYDESCFYEVHGFADASSEAYSSVVYLRCVLGNSNSTALLCSKSRIAPSKSTTIPRLELSACVLLSEHVKSVILALSKQISIKNVYCWSDSLIALWWIKQNHKTWKLWIQNRVKKIRENVNTEHWN